MTLIREFKVTSESAITAIDSILRSNWKPLHEAGETLHVIITSAQEKRRAQQNKYYWSVVINSIATQAWSGGRQFGADVWHEYLSGMYGIKRDIELPDCSVVLKRLSTSEMTVREFSEYTEKVTVYGATELGIKFPAMV